MHNVRDVNWQKWWQAIQKRPHWLFGIGGFLLGLMVSPLLHNFGGFLIESIPEAIGAGFTIWMIDRIYQWRQGQTEEADLKTRLIRELGSSENITALNALRELRAHGWLTDGSLNGISLRGADLSSADLKDAVMESADLRDAVLTGVDFTRTHLARATMTGAYLNNARFVEADLERATLDHATLKNTTAKLTNFRRVNFQNTTFYNINWARVDLTGADFTRSYLEAAQLYDANLQGVLFRSAQFMECSFENSSMRHADLTDANIDKKTVLPDLTTGNKLSFYRPRLDPDKLDRFTDPEHPEFWQPEWAENVADVQPRNVNY